MLVESLCSTARVDASSSTQSLRDLQVSVRSCSDSDDDSMTVNVSLGLGWCKCDEDDDDNDALTLRMGRFAAALGGRDTPADGGRCSVCIVAAG